MSMDVVLQMGAAAGFWDDYGEAIRRLFLYAGGIFVYAILVNWFYQRLDKRVMFGKKGADGRVHIGGPGRGFLYLIMFPVVSLAFFLLLSAAILFLAPDRAANPTSVFTVAMAIVLAVRVSAYFSEPTAHDVAKMLPLGLLGVFLVTGRAESFGDSVQGMMAIPDTLDVVVVFFAIVILVEYVLRISYVITRASRPKGPQMRRTASPPPRAAPGPPRPGDEFRR